ncbi:MAG: hypothetical protein C4526_11310 [Nitrospiraceae bacterium]|nr:MAG: hypothetical protein C4526_11310 [Nitrospiraceae bacterium]
MSFLIDMPVSPEVARWLKEKGYDAVHASETGLHKTPDREIIEAAKKQKRIIITADLDYPQILALSGASSPGVILFRGGNYSDSEMLALIARVLDKFTESELMDAISVVDKYRIRRIKLPIDR